MTELECSVRDLPIRLRLDTRTDRKPTNDKQGTCRGQIDILLFFQMLSYRAFNNFLSQFSGMTLGNALQHATSALNPTSRSMSKIDIL